MNVTEWVSTHGRWVERPKTQTFKHELGFMFCLCGMCGYPIDGPWYGNSWWELDEIINMINVYCNRCRAKNRVSKIWKWYYENPTD